MGSVRGDRNAQIVLSIDDLTICVLGYEFSRSNEFWDGNWLEIEARASSSPSVEIIGPLLRNTEIEEFVVALADMQRKRRGTARLNCLEPNLAVRLAFNDDGRVTGEAMLTPDSTRTGHAIPLDLHADQLPPILAACRRILDEYPVVGVA